MAKENTMFEEFRTSSYETMEDRMIMHEELHKVLEGRLGENYTPEEYVRFCRESCIEIPIMPPAYAWRI